ncbi:MAG: NADH dehydrogenase subunit D, partial [Acidipropionibacterium jensenii]|nr:NADH dehydrogenase subunit D [Acidipropionibacterium jensenii]
MSENSTPRRDEFLAQGGDWSDIVAESAERGDETVVDNFGPAHPTPHRGMRRNKEH